MPDPADAAPDPFVPVVVGVSIHGASVIVDWDTVPGAADYQVEVLGADGEPVDPPPAMEPGGDGSSVVLSGPALADGTSITVRVRSVSAWSPPTGVAVVVLTAPAAPALSFAADRIQASWAAVPGAAAYEVEVLDADGLPLYPQPPATVDGSSAEVDASALATGVEHGVRVRASAGIAASAWGEAGTVRISRVPQPEIVEALYSGGKLDFTWSPVPGATRYLVQVLDADGARLVPQPSVSGFNHSATVAGAGIGGGARVQVQVGVEVAGQGTAWSDPLPLALLDLPAPNGVAATAAAGAWTARWSEVPGAESYRVEVVDAQGQPVPAIPPVTVQQPSVRMDAPADGGDGMQVRVTATAPHVQGATAEPVPFAAHVLPAPDEVMVVYLAAERRASLSWSAVEGAAAYVVGLLLDGAPLPGQPALETAATHATLAATLAPGTAYQVRVRAARPDADGAWATESFVALDLAAPAGLGVRAADDGFRAAWAPVPGAAGYQVRVLDADAEPLAPAPTVAVEGTTARISGPALAAAGYFEVRVRATAPGVLGPFGEPATPGLAAGAPPAGVRAVYHSASRRVTASWAPVPGVGSYEARLVSGGGAPAGDAVSTDDTRASLDASALAEGGAYAVQVRAATAEGDGDWCAPAPFPVVDLRPPVVLRAFAGAEGIRVEWAPVEDAAGYEVRLDDGEGARISPAPEVSVAGTSAFVPAAALAGRSYVEVRARATVQGAVGTWSAPHGVPLAASPAAADDHDGAGHSADKSASSQASTSTETSTEAPADAPPQVNAPAVDEDAGSGEAGSTASEPVTGYGADRTPSTAAFVDDLSPPPTGAPLVDGGASGSSEETPSRSFDSSDTSQPTAYPPAESDESGGSAESGASDESGGASGQPSEPGAGDAMGGGADEEPVPPPQHVPGVETIPGMGGEGMGQRVPDAEEVEAVG